MRDHRRILGSLFVAWAVLQAVTMVVLASVGGMAEEPLAWKLVRWALVVLAAVVYGVVGLRLRAHDPRVRVFAIVFSALALLSFPVGTALGIYGLWVLLRRPAQAPA